LPALKTRQTRVDDPITAWFVAWSKSLR